MDADRLIELASKPAGQDQIDRARQYAAGDAKMLAEVDAMLATNPTRAQMLALLEKLRVGAADRKLDQAATAMCAALGNANPSTLEKLLAIQIHALHEQTELLARMTSQMRSDSKSAAGSGGAFNAILAGWIAGAVARS